MVKWTWKTLIVAMEIAVIIAVVSVSSSYIYFRYFTETSFRPSESLSLELRKEVDNFLSKNNFINGVQVVRIDLKRNVRYLIFTTWNTPELQKLYDNFSNKRITTNIPVFSEDDLQNARIIRLMNHEFDCTPFKDTLSYKLVPESAEYIKIVCAISIPPAFSEFKGIIAVSLNSIPTDAEKEIIKIVLIDLSDKIYKEIK